MEHIQREINKHRICTPVMPHIELRQLRVHPKDEIDENNKCNIRYETPCHSCNKPTSGKQDGRLAQEKKNTRKNAKIRSGKERTLQENLKSTTTENHIMNSERAKVLRTENNTPPALHRGDDSETSQHNHDPPFPHLERQAKGRGRSRPVYLDGSTPPQLKHQLFYTHHSPPLMKRTVETCQACFTEYASDDRRNSKTQTP